MVFLVALGLLMAALFLVASGIVGILAWAGLLDLSDYPSAEPGHECPCAACRSLPARDWIRAY